jgi:uncharacterized damage-inducible protein DinB
MDEQRLRQHVVDLLRGGGAHASWDQALEGLPAAHRAKAPRRGLHTVWELVEHLRIAQEDILRYALEPGGRSPEWPEGYWPSVKEPTPRQWKASLAAFRRDLEAVVGIVEDPQIDLTAAIPHGQAGHTYLREALLVADHNAYHLAQVVVARRLLGDWK